MRRKATRRTGQREAIERGLMSASKPLTAHELFVGLRKSGREVGLATVYRNLNRLVEEGMADALKGEFGEQAFLYCGEGHHHHLACRICGRVEQVRNCAALEEWTRRVAGAHRFTAVEHRTELIGVCGDCAG